MRSIRAVLVLGLAAACVAREAAADQPPSGGAAPPTDAELRDYLSANGLANRGLHEPATVEYRRFLDAHPDHAKAPSARYALAICLYHLKQFEAAQAELDRLGDRSDGQFPFAAEAAALRGHCRLAVKQYAAAADAYQQVIERFVGHAAAETAAGLRAEALYLAGRDEECVRQCDDLAKRWPGSPSRARADYFAAAALARSGRPGDAAGRLEAFLKAHAKSELAQRAKLLLAECLARNGALDRAAAVYAALADDSAASDAAPDALFGLATVQMRTGRYAEAAAAFERLLEQHPRTALADAARLELGKALLESGRMDEAERQFESLSKAGPALAEPAAYWQAKCDLRRGRYEEAAEAFERYGRKYPTGRLAAEALFDHAVALARAERWADAARRATAFRETYADHALSPDALHLAAVCAHRQRKDDACAAACREFRDAYPAHALAPAMEFLAAENDFLAGRFEAAATGFRRVCERRPADPNAQAAAARLGLCLHRLRRHDEAAGLLTDVANESSDAAVTRAARLALGDMCFQRGDWKGADRWLSQFLEGAPLEAGADDALLKRGLALRRLGRLEEALHCFDRVDREFPQSELRIPAVFERGQTHLAAKRPRQAREDFERVAADGGDSNYAIHARSHLAGLAAASGDAAAAVKLYDDVLRGGAEGEAAATALYQKGVALLAAGDFAAAEKSLNEFARRFGGDSRAPAARVQLALALARQDRHAEALAAMQEAERAGLAGVPAALVDALAYERGWCLRAIGRKDEAARAFEKVVQTDGANLPDALLQLGELEADAGRFQAAARWLRRLYERAGGDSAAATADVLEKATYRLAICESELGRHEAAARLFEEVGERFPESDLCPSAAQLAGEAWFTAGRLDKAATSLERFLARHGEHTARTSVLLRLGECLAGLQRWERSARAFEQVLAVRPECAHWYAAQFGVGWAFENQNRHEQAMAAYRKVVERHQGPTAARAQFQIGECLFALARYDDAVRELLKVDILYAYPEWSAAALFEAGRCLEKLNRTADARAQYRRVVEKHADTHWAAQAAARLKNLHDDAPPGR